ncbi:hypothetical protein B0H65DRAFT_527843 [Neurospora tetraspora]|uniref:DUF7587 domain-containing protein n=1 Tax=Neurospora tetraspora TaxID=94610 RepID=A0AAE0JEY7_9PEZI|nr:hypothetical protein B0H65DRAFT_527843 [Neurospora tetraspora]
MEPLVAPIIFNFVVPCWELPRYLYFVEHARSQTCRNNQGDFEAADLFTPLRGPMHLHQRISEHVNWAYRGPTSFISTFADDSHAMNWARQRQGPVTIHRIDTCELDDRYCWVFYASDFTQHCFESEFLFLHTIPGHAIVSTWTLGRSIRSGQRAWRPQGYY